MGFDKIAKVMGSTAAVVEKVYYRARDQAEEILYEIEVVSDADFLIQSAKKKTMLCFAERRSNHGRIADLRCGRDMIAKLRRKQTLKQSFGAIRTRD